MLSSHGFGVTSALALAQALGTLPKNWVLYGIEIENDCPDSTISAAVREATTEVAQRIVGELRTLLTRANGRQYLGSEPQIPLKAAPGSVQRPDKKEPTVH